MDGRRRLLAGVVAAGALALTGACSSGAAEPAPRPGPTAPAGPALLTVAVYGPPPVITAYTKIAADFSAEHPDIVVNVRPYDSHAAAAAALARQRSAGNAPDAFTASLADLPGLVRDDAVQGLDVLLGEREVDFGDGYQRDALEAFSADNALQCMPVDVSPLVVYYNTDLVDLSALTEEGGKPITAETGWKLADFAQAARNASRGRVKGLYLAPELSQVAPFVWSGGGHLVDDLDAPATLQLSDPSSEAALEQLLEVVRDPSLTFDQAQLQRRSALQRFKAGQLAMILGYRDLTPRLRQQQGLSFDVMPLPRISARATSGERTAICLSKDSEHTEETADFLASVVSTAGMAELARTGYVVPTNLDVVNSDDFAQPGQSPANAQVFAENVRRIYSYPTVDTWPSVARHTAELLQGLFYDPVIDPLDGRLRAIDAASAPLFTPVPSPPASPTASPTTSPEE